ncbi:MAG: hypothetical protein M3539_03680, partial [Acidobacteriota bacterium]|nr:hypothetical protein [Acidobacteriota bacterium]
TLGGATNPFLSLAGDVTGNGRFVVIESNGDIATQNKNNADGNFELFLFDYAQRRIFQLTNTKNVTKAPASPTPTPSPAASPTPTPTATPADPAQVQIEISNKDPMISFEPVLVGGTRVYTIVFTSNAPHPASFDGTSTAALAADANQEIWIYRLPAVTDVNLASGDDLFQDLTLGSFSQITNTSASRPPFAGSAEGKPQVAFDNREPTISDNGDIVAFISTRSLVGTGNADGNPELFFATRTAANWSSFTFAQGTTTQDAVQGIGRTFQQNPSLSSDGSVVAFLSSANLTGSNDDGSGRGNAEVYVANFAGALGNVRQVTRTKADTGATGTNATVNILSPGRRLSRNGALIALETLAEDPKANTTTTNKLFFGMYVYNVASDTFTQVGLRATTIPGDIFKFPTFTDYNSLGAPSTLVFASGLNFKADGSFPAADQTATGLNPTNQPQIFAATLPAGTGTTFARLTNNPTGGFGGIRPLTTNTQNRLTFSLGGSELGGGNPDSSVEVFYLLVPAISSENAGVLSFFAGASNFPVATATPAPSPAPAPGSIALGLAAGELSIVRSTVALAPADKAAAGFPATGVPEAGRSPILPIELNGVSVSIAGAAAGLYFVGNDPAEGITFVMPIGLSTGLKSVVINNNGTVLRGFVNVVPAQPDIFSSTNDAGGVARVCNITIPSGCILGPFTLTSSNGTTTVPTILEIWLTGVRGITAAETRVKIGTTEITPTSVLGNTNMFGFDLVTITLPSSLAPGTYPLIVTVTKNGTFQSRAEATAPTITIIP